MPAKRVRALFPTFAGALPSALRVPFARAEFGTHEVVTERRLSLATYGTIRMRIATYGTIRMRPPSRPVLSRLFLRLLSVSVSIGCARLLGVTI